ncbi:MAG: hypothetical protein PUK40_04045 [Actinomycetaceae bacterium]|nr:hypothetical protein [Arcanobacterium sp.]MDD7505107.1 hypothetical protein [Actinomycetaceae bacterium]MDY6142624.1 hypothetical protein [Arcanobacterium sp.]
MVTNALDAYLFGEKVGTFIKQSPLPREKYEADGGPWQHRLLAGKLALPEKKKHTSSCGNWHLT